MIQHLLEFFTPRSIAADTSSWEYQRTHLFIVAVLIILSISLLCAGLYYASASPLLGHFSTLTVVFACSILTLLRWSQKIRLSAMLLIAYLFVVTVICVCITGGIHSFFLSVLYAPAILAVVIFNRIVMVWSVVFSLIIIAVFIVLNEFGVYFPVLFAPKFIGILTGVLQSSMLIGVMAAFFYSEAVRQKAFQLLEGERDSVQAKIRTATQTLQEQQDSILHINSSLEKKNTQLESAIQEAESAKKLQTEFLRNVSHEVRTPLTAVMGFTEIVASRLPNDDALSKGFMHQISLAGQNLMDIFTNILTLASLEANTVKFSFERVQIQALVNDVERSMRPLAIQKGLEFRASIVQNSYTQEYAALDMQYTRDIMRHLLSNAIKFTAKGAVSLTCKLLSLPKENMPNEALSNPPGETILRIAVSDTGIGITTNEEQLLFTPFSQHDGSKTREYEGLGLGLAITKRLVDGMNGRIWYESKLGQGATFIVELPVTKQE
jgi:signal transduction histidine kinase